MFVKAKYKNKVDKYDKVLDSLINVINKEEDAQAAIPTAGAGSLKESLLGL